ncbi:MAG: protein kinase [Bryobacteraceae bacterium]
MAERIGRGGMGEVYRAHDPRLDRDVAIKVLPPDLAHDYERLRRFQAEARAVAALNHPNIISVHEIGNSDGLIWMATELVEGRSLREHLEAGPVTSRKAIEIAAQISDGLAAAHAAGIVHRDLKPENVMLSEGDRVKILDFGIAKWRGRSREALAGASTLTKTGEVVGTATAMSPEQVLGHEVDHRSDIFSLGVLLYEMLAGKHPFRGDNAVAVMHAIVEVEPEDLPVSVPESLAGIVRRCLEKSPERRFQTAADLGFALRMAANAQLRSKEVGGGQLLLPETQHQGRSRLRRSYPRILTLGAVLLVVAGVLWLRLRPARVPFEHVRLERLTTSGDTRQAAISPDGKYIARIAEHGDEQTIQLRQLHAINEVQIVPDVVSGLTGLHFSHDGEYVYYTQGKVPNGSALYRVPTLGGSPELVLDDAEGIVAVSPDEHRFAYLSGGADQSFKIVVVGPNTGDRKTLLTKRAPDFLRPNISWSPDGRQLAIPIGSFDDRFWQFENVLIVSVKNAEASIFSPFKWSFVSFAEWLQSGRNLLIVGGAIWSVPYPTGAARQITSEISNYSGVSLTADSSAFVTVQMEELGEMWVTSAGAGPATQLTRTSATADGAGCIAWTPKGQLVYTSGAPSDLWLMDGDGTNPKQLTFGGVAAGPEVSRDGGTIYFGSERSGACHLWRMSIDGSGAKQVTFGPGERCPSVSPDGKWLVYERFSFTRSSTIWKMPLPSGTPVRIGNLRDSEWPAVSPDGKWLLFGYSDEHIQPPEGLGIMRLDGTGFRALNIPNTTSKGWSSDSHSIYYVKADRGVDNVWRQLIIGGRPARITNSSSGSIGPLAVSRQDRIAFRHAIRSYDAVLVRDLK